MIMPVRHEDGSMHFLFGAEQGALNGVGDADDADRKNFDFVPRTRETPAQTNPCLNA